MRSISQIEQRYPGERDTVDFSIDYMPPGPDDSKTAVFFIKLISTDGSEAYSLVDRDFLTTLRDDLTRYLKDPPHDHESL